MIENGHPTRAPKAKRRVALKVLLGIVSGRFIDGIKPLVPFQVEFRLKFEDRLEGYIAKDIASVVVYIVKVEGRRAEKREKR